MKKFIPILSIFIVTFKIYAQDTIAKPDTLIQKTAPLKEIIITKTKKAVEQKADRTIFNFSDQPHLNNGSLMEGVKKLPGLIVSDVAGMMYQGKLLEVYLNGRPLGISGDQLNAFLEGMPANSIERIEIITQPGAEFPATSGGAILNIITNKNSKKYLSATYSSKYSFSNYDQYRNQLNNSMMLNARNKYFGWQMDFGHSYSENFRESEIDDITNTFTNRRKRGYFIKTALIFELGIDKLLANYDWNYNNNDANTNSAGFQAIRTGSAPNYLYNLYNYTTNDFGKTYNTKHDASITYQKRFDDIGKKLDFQFSFNQYRSQYDQKGSQFIYNITQNYFLETDSKQNTYLFKTDYSQPVKILDEGKISAGGLYEKVDYDTQNSNITNLDYQRQTTGAYVEAQAEYKKFNFITGVRFENYSIHGKVLDENTGLLTKDLTAFKKSEFFPNASLQYHFMKNIFAVLNYNRKIKLPDISSLNPNNTNYQNGNISFSGNPFLQPTIFNNFEIKLSAYDYAFIGYTLSLADNQTVQVVDKNYFFPEQPIIDGREAYGVSNQFINISQMKIHNFDFGIPLPFMLFTKGLKEAMKFDFNPDKINFMYLYAGYQLHEIPDLKNNGFWIFNLMTQFVLPKDIKIIGNYSTMTTGNWYYYYMERPWLSNIVDITVSKKFMKDRLSVSLFANDIFRTNRNALKTLYNQSNVFLGNRFDGQNFGISINYKIPTKNKLAKEDSNRINQQNEENNKFLTP